MSSANILRTRGGNVRKMRVLGREREKITSSRGEKNQTHLKWFTNGGSGQAAPDVGQVGNLQT